MEPDKKPWMDRLLGAPPEVDGMAVALTRTLLTVSVVPPTGITTPERVMVLPETVTVGVPVAPVTETFTLVLEPAIKGVVTVTVGDRNNWMVVLLTRVETVAQL